MIQAVLRWPLPQLQSWMERLVIGEPVGGNSFNWHGLAFSIAARAQRERSLEWARIAIRVYEALAHQSDDPYSFMLSAMNLRTWLIQELGAREGDELLDPEIIYAWFRSLATIPIDEAKRVISTPDWRTIPTDVLLQLRYTKTALSMLSTLSQSGVALNHPELEDWFPLREQLP
ncbi:hypothetical protein LZ198_39335 [Myxococcus sp. K15C18031901]|uniref:hypothetical protein n=1 Tax=Myxococcus dinghuensis TaxID=2906761 RepID=UPI0020A7B39F|nr:hypothetical protein [Myxococcus dinghuensis]MCP3104937.1 hypothetical protein [Myxococcus dinghuensis]